MNKVEGQTPHEVQSPQLRFTQRNDLQALRVYPVFPVALTHNL